ncbi:MAG: Xaa-Pro peptidase family protein [Acidobacteria bacterium]|nr:Xaa-Pro peptidase family protein [Acidobacteriota bacterium]
MAPRTAAYLHLVILACLLASEARGGTSPPPVPKAEYSGRRRALAAGLGEELAPGALGVLLLRSLPEQENATFRQESNLYYLTGTEIPESALILIFGRPSRAAEGAASAAPARYAEYIYLPERDYRQEKWTGPKPGPGALDKETLKPDIERLAAMQFTGFDQVPEGDFPPRRWPKGPVERSSDLPGQLSRFLSEADVLFFSADPGVPGEPLSGDLAFLNDLRSRYPRLQVKDSWEALGRLRMLKSPAEIQQIRRAVEITCQALQDALSSVRPGAAEYQVQAEVERRFTLEGSRRPGYPSIVGSGPNSCILHYDASERTMVLGDLLLMDVGAEFRHYSADVTRTFPVGGRFSDEQRKVYNLVLKAQEAVLGIIKPGVPFSELDRTARKVIADAGYGQFFIHGTSHYLGLDVHDAGDSSALLQPGMIFTVEPGIYIPDKQIGVRIEDDVLVTSSGAEILSSCLPRKADAVEMQIRKALKSGTR